MKIGIFTDSHYSSRELTCKKRFNNQSLRKIEIAYAAFRREGCALAVCLGDLIDTESTVEKEIENLSQIASVMQNSGVPTVSLMGNHDAFTLTPEQFYSTLGIDPPKDLCIDGRNLIFLDACYHKNGTHYAPGPSDWKDTFLPNAEELQAKLSTLSEPTYLFIHQNVDPEVNENHRLFNADEVFGIINQSGVVKSVFQGHYHPGKRSFHDGVQYVTLPAMCEIDDGFWILEL